MKDYILIINQEGKPKALEVPDKSNYRYAGVADEATTERHYQMALLALIADTSKHIEFMEPDAVTKEAIWSVFRQHTDKATLHELIGRSFPLPPGYRLEVEWHKPCIKLRKCSIANENNEGNCNQVNGHVCKKEHRVATLIAIEPSQEPSKMLEPALSKLPQEGEKEFDGSTQWELQWGNHERRIRVNCPDEDSEMYIQIKRGKQYAGVSLSLDEAEEMANYILGHIKNERTANPQH